MSKTKKTNNGVIYLPKKIKINPDAVTPKDRMDLAYTRAILGAACLDAGKDGLRISANAVLRAIQATEIRGTIALDFQRIGDDVLVRFAL